MKPMRAEERLIVALDFNSARSAIDMVNRLKDRVKTFKVGSELYTSCGPRIVEELHKRGCRVFLDLKFHDIPTTVAKSVACAAKLGVFMINVHASGGEEMMMKAAESARTESARSGTPQPTLIAVTVLTSMDRNGLKKLGFDDNITTIVARLARLAKKSGLDGVVSSPDEIAVVRKSAGEDFLIVTPGVRPLWATAHDQKRIATPGEALLRGADYIVVGRPVTGAGNPEVACERIMKEMKEGENHVD